MIKLEYLKFTDELALGFHKVDEQHKTLIGYYNKLVDAYNVNSVDPHSILDEMTRYAKTHFEFEERFLRDVKYPYYQEHVDLHMSLVEQIADKCIMTSQVGSVMTDDLLIFVKNWIVHHIMEEDKKYVVFFTEKHNCRK